MQTAPKLLLCVEDDSDDIAIIEDTVHEIDDSMLFVSKPNGKEALIFLNRQKQAGYLPNFILLDLNMPIMDGVQVLEELKKDPIIKNIPVTVFTTSSSEEDQQRCRVYGVEMVTKPSRLYEFKTIVTEVVLANCF